MVILVTSQVFAGMNCGDADGPAHLLFLLGDTIYLFDVA
jgi:hypothetical protein